jgi:hypothetical protein
MVARGLSRTQNARKSTKSRADSGVPALHVPNAAFHSSCNFGSGCIPVKIARTHDPAMFRDTILRSISVAILLRFSSPAHDDDSRLLCARVSEQTAAATNANDSG